jgi:hypothetical protein
MLLWSGLAAASAPVVPVDIQRALERAEAQAQTGDLAGAIATLEQAEAQDPDAKGPAAAALARWSGVRLRAGDRRAACTAGRLAVRLNPGGIEAWRARTAAESWPSGESAVGDSLSRLTGEAFRSDTGSHLQRLARELEELQGG